jgi:integrase
MQQKLTGALVRELTEQQPPEREHVIWDLVLPRFGLRLRPPKHSGGPWRSAFLVQYRTHDGGSGKMLVGTPATHTLEEARKAAKAVLRKVDSGHDPIADKRSGRAAWTVATAVDAYLAGTEFARKTGKTRAVDAALFQNHIMPRLGREKLSSITVPAVRRLLRAIEGDQRVNARKRRLGGPCAARKAVRLFSSLLSWAVNEGQIVSNPIIGHLRLEGDGQRETILDRPDQYAALFATMDRMVTAWERRQAELSDPAARSRLFHPRQRGEEREPVLPPAVRALFILAACTGMRRSEMLLLTWGQVDLAARRITLHTSKGSRLARRGPKRETVSLHPLAVAALAGLVPNGESDPAARVFPSRGAVLSVGPLWQAVRDEAGLPGDLTLHGLRHSIGTNGVIAGLGMAEVQKLLRHRNISTTQRYIHLAEAATTRLQDRAIAHLLPAAPGGAGVGEDSPTVRPLRRRVKT